eukprot:5983654-Prymnesium_polylepis.1
MCTAPAASAAGALIDAAPHTEAELADSFELYGGASITAAASSGGAGALRLIGRPTRRAGSAVLRAAPSQPLPEFNLSCVVRFGGRGRRDGVSLSYGGTPAYTREFGGGGGLRIVLRAEENGSTFVRAYLGHALLNESR